MQWEGREESQNVDDRRGIGMGGKAAIGGGGLIILLIAVLLGVDPRKAMKLVDPGNVPGQQVQRPIDPQEERQANFTKIVFRDTEIVWEDLFRKAGRQYRKPTLVLFNNRTDTACGLGETATGPFYCPGDDNVYIDLSFFQVLERKLNSPGDFARAYVVAHEVGHHVQKLLGYSARVDDARRSGNPVEANNMSVRLELQADYLAGVWAHHAQAKFKYLDRGDVDSALRAAFEIGDDRLQKRSRGTVVPDSFTHGTSKQRQRWFTEGFRAGDVGKAALLFDMRYGEL